jgi:hypothetical protein
MPGITMLQLLGTGPPPNLDEPSGGRSLTLCNRANCQLAANARGKAMAGSTKVDGTRGGSRRRIAAWATAAILLLLPLIAMPFTDEVNWDETDFAVGFHARGNKKGRAWSYDRVRDP